MRYFDAPVLPAQRKKIEPHKFISGNWPGATQMRIGGDENISIDGLNKRISISTGGGTVSFGLDATGNTGIVINDGTTDLLVIDADGMHFHDATDERMRVGVQPDDSLNVVITKPGEDIEDVF